MLLQEWLLEMKVDISTPASLRYQWEKKSLFILPTKGLSLQLLAISRKWFGNKIPVTAMMTQEGENIKCQHYWPNILGQKKKQWSATGFGWLLWQCSSWRASVRAMTPEDIQMWCDRRCDIFHPNFTAWLDHKALSPQPQNLLLSLEWDTFPDWAQSSHTAHWLWMFRDPDCTDVVLGLIDQDLAFDISDFVHCILQKHGMVQTDDQYIFCYQVILYVLTCL